MPIRLAYLGHVNIDRILTVKRLPETGSEEVISTREVNGGTAGNFAIVAARLGMKFDLYSAVSNKSHHSYIQYLEGLGVDCGLLERSDRYGPVCTIVSDGAEQIAFMDQGPMSEWNASSSFKLDRSYDWVHFSTGPPGEYLRIAEAVKGRTRITFDPGQEINYRYDKDTVKKFTDLSDLVICNSSELDRIASLLGIRRKDVLEHLPDTIVTMGSGGVEFSISGKREHLDPVIPERVVDTVGAGDAFRAGFYFGLNTGKNIVQSIRIGQNVASSVIASSPSTFNPDRIADLKR